MPHRFAPGLPSSATGTESFKVQLSSQALEEDIELNMQLQSPLCRLPFEIFEMVTQSMTLQSIDALRHTCKRNYVLVTNGRVLDRQFAIVCKRHPGANLEFVGRTANSDSSVAHQAHKKIVLEYCIFRRSTFRVPANQLIYDISELRMANNYATVVFSRSGTLVLIYDAREVEAEGTGTLFSSWIGQSGRENAFLFTVGSEGLELVDKFGSQEQILGAEFQEVEHGLRVSIQGRTTRNLIDYELSEGRYRRRNMTQAAMPSGIYTEHTAPSNIPFYNNLVQGRVAQRPQTKPKILRKWATIRNTVADANLPTSLIIQHDLPSTESPDSPNLYIAAEDNPLTPLVNLKFPLSGKVTHFAFAGQMRVMNQSPSHSCREPDCLFCWDDLSVFSAPEESGNSRVAIATASKNPQEEARAFLHVRFAVALNGSHIFLFDIPYSLLISALATSQTFTPRKLAFVENLQALVFTTEKISRLCAVSATEFIITEICFSKTQGVFGLRPDGYNTPQDAGSVKKGKVDAFGKLSEMTTKENWKDLVREQWKSRIEGMGGGPEVIPVEKPRSLFARFFSR